MTDEARWTLEPYEDDDGDAPVCVTAGDEDPPDLEPTDG